MTATPADVAFLTNNGRRLTAPDDETADAIKADHIDARDGSDSEIEMYFVDPAHSQIVLDEKAAILTVVDPIHEGIEVEESLQLGSVRPVAPIVPSFQVVDEERLINQACRTRAYSVDLSTDRYSVEVVQ